MIFESTVKQGIQHGIELLDPAIKNGLVDNSRLEAELLLAHVLHVSRSNILIYSERMITKKEYDEYVKLLHEKINGTPTAYLLGYSEFYGYKYIVDPSTLIPRPETEELVEWIIQSQMPRDFTHRNSNDSPVKILDMCTGSGCIGITLACEIEIDQLYLVDVSADALKIAERNTELLRHPDNNGQIRKNIDIQIAQSNLFENIDSFRFHFIVSNPPYVTGDEYEYLDKTVKDFEPCLALLVNEPGKFNTQLVTGAFAHLADSGWLYLETSPLLANSIHRIMNNTGFHNVEIKKDLSGKDRFIRGQK